MPPSAAAMHDAARDPAADDGERIPRLILALDTSSHLSSMALLRDGELLAEDQQEAEGRHSEAVLPQLHGLLRRAGVALPSIDLLAVGLGPGNFTGLRVGLATAKALHFACGVRLQGFCSLMCLVPGEDTKPSTESPASFIACTDARRGEVYAAVYRRHGRDQGLEECLPPLCAAPMFLLERLQQALPDQVWHLYGNGAELCKAAWQQAGGSPPRCVFHPMALPQATQLARQALVAWRAEVGSLPLSDAAQLEPLYVRASDAQLPSKPLSSA